MARLEPGQAAPDFTLEDHDGEQVTLSDYRGRKVVLYFYPADDTPGCTKESCQFNERLDDFDDAGAVVLGVSPDTPSSHRAFRERYGLEVRLLCDPEHQAMDAYGAWGEKSLYGRVSIGVIRSTFLITANGTIERAWYNVRADGHAAKVLAELGGADAS